MLEKILFIFFLLIFMGSGIYLMAIKSTRQIDQIELCYSQNGKVVSHETFKSCQENDKVIFILIQ